MRPHVLVTGFPAFPTAPVNPTERLIELLGERDLTIDAEVRAAVVPCAYGEAPAALEALGREYHPDIVLAFGLSRRAKSFTLERIARNLCTSDLPDTSGECRRGAPIVADSPGELRSTLPLVAIHKALRAKDIAADFSDDAGGYLCNFVFYLIVGHHIPSLKPAAAGFIHVPAFGTDTESPSQRFSQEILWRGACACLNASIESWRIKHIL
ncbi:pyroglutamyl-peptidase I [Rhodoligotrophos ferricapiens]|uniref:pyroglutamyl-peptidase I n=1 Tax=Rhodoligotrophos ferricapiens TaxID=3069264 RepID=UPI00315C6C58